MSSDVHHPNRMNHTVWMMIRLHRLDEAGSDGGK
jgi:hypothetical protein